MRRPASTSSSAPTMGRSERRSHPGPPAGSTASNSTARPHGGASSGAWAGEGITAVSRRGSGRCVTGRPDHPGASPLDRQLARRRVRWPFDGVEVYNHVCRWLNGKGEGRSTGTRCWRRNPATLALAVDDAHLRPEHPGWNGGWIVVNAAERAAQPILDAIRRGNFYASCGPEFRSIAFDGTHVAVETSAVQFIRLVGPAYRGIGRAASTASADRPRLRVPADWDYAYLEIEDEQGRRAWTNTLFCDAPKSPSSSLQGASITSVPATCASWRRPAGWATSMSCSGRMIWSAG